MCRSRSRAAICSTRVSGRTVTTFVVNPLDGGMASEVSISTELESRRGPAGVLRRWLTRRLLEPLYVEELRLLSARARSAADDAASAR